MQPHELKAIFNELRRMGLIATQTEFGEKFGWKKAYTSEALNVGKIPKDMKERLAEAFPDVDFAPMFARLTQDDQGQIGESSPHRGRTEGAESALQAKIVAILEDRVAEVKVSRELAQMLSDSQAATMRAVQQAEAAVNGSLSTAGVLQETLKGITGNFAGHREFVIHHFLQIYDRLGVHDHTQQSLQSEAGMFVLSSGGYLAVGADTSAVKSRAHSV